MKFLIKKICTLIMTLFLVSVAAFLAFQVIPGDVVRSILGTEATPEREAQLREELGLDKPPVEQFFIYCKNLLHGDMGTSYKKIGKSVNAIIAQTMIPTLKLGAVTFVLVLVVGIGSGILMARSKSNVTKGIWLSALTLGVSVPNFIVALLLLIIFGVELRIFPVLGLTSPMHYVLPEIF